MLLQKLKGTNGKLRLLIFILIKKYFNKYQGNLVLWNLQYNRLTLYTRQIKTQTHTRKLLSTENFNQLTLRTMQESSVRIAPALHMEVRLQEHNKTRSPIFVFYALKMLQNNQLH